MTSAQEREVLEAAIDVHGERAQITMAVEEMGELLAALAQHYRGRVRRESVVDEIADVLIVVQQLALIYGVEDVRERYGFKMERLAERLKGRAS